MACAPEPSGIMHDAPDATTFDGTRAPGDARAAIHALGHPLVGAPNGFREFPNQKPWTCRFCATVIAPAQGYWGNRRRFSGSREYAKVCAACFLKLLRFLDENPRLSRLLRANAAKRIG